MGNNILVLDYMAIQETSSFVLTLRGKTPDGKFITPKNTRIDDLFNQIKDARNLVMDDTALISFEEGSLKMILVAGGAIISALVADIKSIQLGHYQGIPQKRVQAIESLMNRAKKNNWEYDLATPDEGSVLVLSKSSSLPQKNDTWIPLSSVIAGKVMDAGGKSESNIHLDIDGKTITIKTTEDQLRASEKNILYKSERMKVSYLFNPNTGEKKNYKLLQLIEPPILDNDKLAQFIEQGTRDWSDIPDITMWVENQRKGGDA